MSRGNSLVRSLVLTLVVLVVWMSGAPVRAVAQLPVDSTRVDALEPLPVVVWNREITRFRTPLENLSLPARVRIATERIESTPRLPEYRLEQRPLELGGQRGVAVLADGRMLFALYEKDLDAGSGETLDSAGRQAVVNLRAWLAARDQQLRWPDFLRGVAWSIAATVAAAALLLLLVRLSRRLRERIESPSRQPQRAIRVGKADVRPYIHTVEAGLVRSLAWALIASILYLWLTFVLSQFPYTRPWGLHLGAYILSALQRLGQGFIRSIPNLFFVGVIFFATRLLARVISAFFRGARSQGMEAEIARATERLVLVLLWVFALVIAYPYLPGSGTAAFQGVSVFVGIMVSLGATGIVSQLLGGLVVVYSRAFAVGDYVKIGEHEGTVTDIGGLAAKVLTLRREEVTIPHSVLVGGASVNYSRQARKEGAVVRTFVAVGYDVPWRQVEA
ncbi:MAG TPA: mechanosensitive ion channel domain-containing protein, partial [Candidatus Eisenbacteria bacterium]|nr:mechanosensitive ion channel domain-containing protein [Candidatus Eisenbacteria bacterium]